MDYTFSWGMLFLGFFLMIAGAAVTIFHQQIIDFLGGDMGDYDKLKLGGVITVAVGFLTATNLLPFILITIVKALFHPPV